MSSESAPESNNDTLSRSSSEDEDKGVDEPVYEDLRRQKIECDFTIKIDGESFPVHQITLTTHSEYFRAMLAHDTKENQLGMVDIKNVYPVGVRKCIEFMYTGQVTVNEETVEDTLQVSDMMQLSKIKEECVEFFTGSLQSGNSVSILNMATKYCCPKLQELSKNIYQKYFGIELTELFQLSKDHFLEILKTHSLGNEVAWDGISNWIKHVVEKRSEFVFELVEFLDWNVFPSAEFLQRLWTESFFRNCPLCQEFLFEKLFMDLEMLKSNLCIENYFILKKLSKQFKHVIKQMRDLINDFFIRNIILLSLKTEFKHLDSEEILSLFQLHTSDIFAPQTWWWNTAVTWINQNPDNKQLFPKLLRLIKIDQLRKSFVTSVVIKEPLVRESVECFEIVINALAQQRFETKESIVVLYSNGRVRAFNVKSKLWKDLTESPEPVQNAEIFSFNGKLCLINGAKLFYLQKNKWIENCSIGYYGGTSPKKVTILDDCVYVVYPEKILCYNTLNGRWSIVPAIAGDIKSVAALNGYLYLQLDIYVNNCSNRQINCRFDVVKEYWMFRLREYHEAINMIAMDDEMYTCNNSMNVETYELHRKWKWEKEFDKDIGRKNQKLAYGSRCNNRLTVSSSIPALINFNERLVYVNSNNKVHIYDEVCCKWNILSEIPVFVAGVKGQEDTIALVSACSL